jgi:Uma2 family endonuclease
MNSIMVIHPYKSDEMWVFDDEKVGLEREPFVAGADRVIDRMVAQIPNAETGFSLLFSAEPFPRYQVRFEWRREEYRGNWYYIEALDMEGWLCPALFKYFETTPAEIYAQFKAKGG